MTRKLRLTSLFFAISVMILYPACSGAVGKYNWASASPEASIPPGGAPISYEGTDGAFYETRYWIIEECDTSRFEYHVKNVGIDVDIIWKNYLEINLNRNYDLIFIDTWHVYGQLKRELDKFSQYSKKYIIMHDTTLDGEFGESLRYKMNTEEQSKYSGFPIEEIEKGLWPAIDEFLKDNDYWELEKKYENCNGLTILKKINQN